MEACGGGELAPGTYGASTQSRIMIGEADVESEWIETPFSDFEISDPVEITVTD